MNLALILFLSGVIVVAWLYGWYILQRRQEHDEEAPDFFTEEATYTLPVVSSDDALLVSQEHGKLIYVNQAARKWLGTNGSIPQLEHIAKVAQPTGNFLELFAHEGQTSFQLGQRWVEATSHRVPTAGEMRTVVIMRELSGKNGHSSNTLDLNLAMTIIQEIGETINTGMGQEQVLQTLLMVVAKCLNYDAGEICLWEASEQVLYQRAWVGDAMYLLALDEAGGKYALGEGISGWIARYREPILVPDRENQGSVQPKLESAPYQCYMGVPLMLGDRFIGTVELACEVSNCYEQADLALLQAISHPIAATILNAQLYSQQATRIDDLASLQKSMKVDPSNEGGDVAVYDALNQRIAELMDADMCGVFVYDEDRQGLVPQLPFHGLPEAAVKTLFIPLPEDSPQHDIWQRQSYWISNDVVGEPLVEALGLQPVVNVAGISNTAWFPLEIGDERIGVIAVSNRRTEGGFSNLDITNLSVLASQAAIIIENLRLYQREKRLDTELLGLQEITSAIGALSHEAEFYSEITERIAHLMNIALCGILLYDGETQQLVSKLPFYGVDDAKVSGYSIDLTPGTVMEQLWDEERYWYSNRVQTDPLVFEAGLNELAEGIGVEKTLMASLYAGGRKLGVVQVSDKLTGEDFTEYDARLLMIFATQAGAIIENARLFQAAQRSAEEAQGLRRVAELAGNVLTTEETFLPVLVEIARLTNSEIVYINVLSQQTGSLITYPRWVHGVELIEPIVQDIYSDGLEKRVTVSHQPYLHNDVLNDPTMIGSYRQVVNKMGIKSVLIVPLIFGERALGELGIANRLDAQYEQDDIDVMQVVASQAAAALDRLLLYEATGQNLNRRLEELDAISRISNELTLTLDLNSVLNVIREEAVKAMNADDSTVALLVSPDRRKSPDVPELLRRVGGEFSQDSLADIEREAISRGADTVIVDDYELSTMEAASPGVRSGIAAAIIYLDQVVGVIYIYHKAPNHFDDRAAAFLMTLASKASLAYGNSERYQDQIKRSEGLRRRVDQLNRIFELGHMFQTNTDPYQILETIAYSVQQSVGFDTVVMLMADDDGQVLRRVAQAGLPVEPFENSKVYTIDRHHLDIILKDDYRISDSYFFGVESFRDWYDEKVIALSTSYDGNRTLGGGGRNTWRDGDMFIVKLTGATGRLIGLMSLDRPHNNQRPERGTVEILEIFAHQAATTIENTRLFLASMRNAEQEARVSEMLETVTSTLDIREIVTSVAESALKMLPFARMTVAIADVEQGFEMIHINVNLDNTFEVKQSQERQLGHTALEHVYNEGLDTVFRAGDPQIEEYEDLKKYYEQGEKISLILPLLTGGENLGAIHIGSDLMNAYGFVESRPVLMRLAQLVASSIQNARLFNQAINLQVLNRSVVESIQQGIIVVNQDGNIISANEFMEARYEWGAPAAYEGQHLLTYRSELAEILQEHLDAVLKSGEPQERINQTTISVDNRSLFSNYYIYPLQVGDIVRGAVILVEDVTERSLLEQAMEARANQLAALTDVSSHITSSLEREEVVQLALEEMGWLIDHDGMSLWRRNGSYLVMEGAYGDVELAQDERILFGDYELLKEVMDSQRVVTSAELRSFPENLPIHKPAESWMGVPIITQGHVVGLIMLTRNMDAAFESKSDQNIAFAFASQVAIALANADLFEQTFDRTNELGTLLEAATATSLTTDLDMVFRIVVELMFSALEMDDCAIMIWDDVDNELEVQVDMNRHGLMDRITAKGTRYSLENYKAKQKALRDREVVVVSRAELDTPYERELKELLENDDTVRMLVPLVVRDTAIGLIQLEQTSEGEVVSQQKVRLARALGSQVAIAIENARLSAQTNTQFEESLVINELSRAISSTLDLEVMIEMVADQVPYISGASELYLALYEPKTDNITFPLVVVNDERSVMPARTLGTDEVSFVIRHRRPLSLGADYFSPDELRKSLDITNGEGDAKSYMGVPLIAGDEVYGVLAVRDRERTRAFTVNVQRVLSTVASQLGAAIQNARLFEQVQNFADELNQQVKERTYELEEERDRIDTLYQITSELARTLDMERLMPHALGMVAKAVNANDGVIMQIDPITDQLYSRAVLSPNSLQENPDGGHALHPAERLARHLIERDEHVVMIDNLHSAEYWDSNAPGAADWQSALAVLLETNEELLGVMVLLSHEQNAFEESHLRLMVAAANQVASSINNAELYKLIRNQAERLGTLLRVEQEEAEKNQAILEGIADGVVLSDADGNIIVFNTAAERILQVSHDQAMGQSLAELTGIYGGTAASWTEALKERFAELDGSSEGEFINERLKLNNRTVSVRLSPVYTGNRFLGTVSVFRDITREVEGERSKSKFIEGVSHEFRTPLTPIKGYIDMVLMGATGEITDGQRNILGTVKNNVDRLALLVEDVLKISQIDSGDDVLKLEELDIEQIYHDIIDKIQARPRHRDKDLSIVFEIDENTPTVEADNEKIARTLVNLVDNAFNYTDSGGTIELGLQPNEEKNEVLLWVRDTGVGIPEEFHDKIWNRFERHEDTVLTLDVAGTGLGLPIAKELVNMHNGEIWFESVADEGTTFYIMLPIEQPEHIARVDRSN